MKADTGNRFSVSSEDVLWWSDLVGDKNPVHFRDEVAQLAGADKAFAHGMLVLILAQLQVWTQNRQVPANQATIQQTQESDYAITSRFKNPSPIGEPIELVDKGRKYAVVAASDQKSSLISGRHTRITADWQEPTSGSLAVVPELLNSVKAKLSKRFGEVPLWLVLQVVWFESFVKTHTSSENYVHDNIQYDTSEHLVLHTRQDTEISSTLFSEMSSDKRCEFLTLNESVTKISDQWLIECSSYVRVDDMVKMKITLELMVRPLTELVSEA